MKHEGFLFDFFVLLPAIQRPLEMFNLFAVVQTCCMSVYACDMFVITTTTSHCFINHFKNTFLFIMHSLHCMLEVNAFSADHVCPSVLLSLYIIQSDNRWTDFNEMWHGHYAIGVCLKVVLFNFL